jgi:putative sigma-54 modulation protein
MKLIYSGKTKEFTPELEEKVVAKLSKLSKFIEQRGEREARVTHHLERHLHKVCIEVKFYDHVLIGEGIDAELDTALCHAIEKIETQVVKLRERWRDTHRDANAARSSKENWGETIPEIKTATEENAPVKAHANGSAGKKPKIYRVNYEDGRKPMTVDEAMIEMEKESDYVVYRDSSKNCLSVLVRRTDGNFDLIES